MIRRLLVAALCSALVGCGGGSSGGSTPAPTPSPVKPPKPSPTPTPATIPLTVDHVVVFVIDNLAVNDSKFATGTTGRYTPAIDTLASQSLVLTNFHTVTPLCSPSRYALLTGNYPSRSHVAYFTNRTKTEGMPVPEFNVTIAAAESTLPKRLRTLGFRTGFVGKNHVTEHYADTAVPAGAHLADNGVAAKLQQNEKFATDEVKALGFDEAYGIYPRNPGELPVVETRVHNLDWITAGALKFIDGNASNKFFLFVSYTVPHAPLGAASSWNADPRMTPFGQLDVAPAVQPARSTLPARIKAANRPAGNENYLWLDDAVSAVMQSLGQHQLLGTTAVFFLSDEGMAPEGVIYNGGTLSPAFISYPGVVGRSGALVSMVDLQPTILQLAGGTPAGDGVSLVPFMRGEAQTARAGMYKELGYARAYRMGNWEYVALRHSAYIQAIAAKNGYPMAHFLGYLGVNPVEQPVMGLFPNYFDRDQLYDLSVDPNEQRNVASDPANAATLTQLKTLLEAEVEKLPGKVKIVE
jgi:arylsulfatase A-like enzyme